MTESRPSKLQPKMLAFCKNIPKEVFLEILWNFSEKLFFWPPLDVHKKSCEREISRRIFSKNYKINCDINMSGMKLFSCNLRFIWATSICSWLCNPIICMLLSTLSPVLWNDVFWCKGFFISNLDFQGKKVWVYGSVSGVA